MMEQYHERLKKPMPTCELTSRQKLVQQAMKKEGIDAIISSNVTGYFGGLDRYLSDTTAEQAYTQSIVIGKEGPAHIVAYGGPPQECYPPRFAIRGCTGCKNRPYFSPFNFTHDWEAKIILEWMEGKSIKKVGYEPGNTYINISDHLEKALPHVEFVDCSNLLDEIRAIKKGTELEFLKDSAFILDKAFGSIMGKLYDGVIEYELRNQLERILTDLGGEEFVVDIGSAPHDGVITVYPSYLQNRVIHNGDQVYVMISSAGAGGCYTTLGRMYSLGKPSVMMENGFAMAIKAQEFIASQLVSGADPQKLLKDYNAFLGQNHCASEQGIFAHGQGYDFIERPSIQAGETMELAQDMCMAIHSNAMGAMYHGFCADSFIITEKGAKRMSKIEQKIFVV